MRAVGGCLVAVRSYAMRFLNVAEKNDAAKTIAGHLSRGTSRRREGLSPYNKIYEFEADVLRHQKCHMVMTSVSGHLLGYEFVGAYKIWRSCEPLALFDAPVAKTCSEDYMKIKLTLEREIRTCDGLIIWTDCDREGENIGFEIIQVCTAIKSHIDVYRAKFSEITSTSVRRAVQNLGIPDKRTSDAVDIRQELDLRIGAAFTRFQTLRLQKVFPRQLADSLISYGSCQFPTLGFVVERYRAVESFVPEDFWKIAVSHELDGLKVNFNWKRNRLFDEQACMVIHDVCTENSTATVLSVKGKPKSKWRPLPLDTIEMEKLGSRKLRINAKEVMKIAEKLYTQGIISYPRTETNIYPKELDLNNLVSVQTENSEWGFFARRILDSGGPTPRQGKKSDQAHPPIHPTKHVTNLTGNDKKVYELIVRSFLACCSKDALGHETNVEIDISGERFTASGLMILERNYLDVYPYEKWNAKEIHVYQEGQQFQPTSLNVEHGQTSAPALLTEADLIALMEKHGIGTDATHADHIETIKSRSYVALADNIHFVPGLLGMGLVEGYDSMGLNFSKPHLRAGLEEDLKAICEGRKSPRDVLTQQVTIYRDVYLTVTQEAERLDQALSGRFNEQPSNYRNDTNQTTNQRVMKCPKCNSDMIIRTKKDNQGFFVSCMAYPQCKNAIWLPSMVESVQTTQQTCETCGPSSVKLEFKWKNRSLDYLYPSPYVGCIAGCDQEFLRTLNISQSSNSRPNSDSSIPHSERVPSNPVRNRSADVPMHSASTNQSRNIPSISRGNENVLEWRQTQTNNNRSTNGFSALNDSPSNSNQDNHIVCNCSEPAILLTVRKASSNMGRQFYKCAKPQENGGCNFFLWASNEESNDNTATNRSTNQTNNWQTNTSSNNMNGHTSNHFNNQQSDDTPVCTCNLPAKKLTVMKEGPNRGRPFYGCPNSVTSRCKFFQWADEGSSDTTNFPSTSHGAGSNNKRKRPNENTGQRAKKKCGNCREEGHTRNRCPQLE